MKVTLTRHKFLKLALAICMIFAVRGVAHAQGDCDRSAWGHDEPWQSYDAGGVNVSVRYCRDSSGNSHLDIKNPWSTSLCVTVVASTSNKRWSNWPLSSGRVLSKQTSDSNEVWEIGAKTMQGTYCKE
jgi:hypothetical protein